VVKRKREWSLLSTHGLVLVALAAPAPRTLNDVAAAVGVGRTTVIRALKDLQSAGMVETRRVGRQNRYVIQKDVNFRHPVMKSSHIGDLLDHLSAPEP
jgi:predicted ArsR family transcriptional regulator